MKGALFSSILVPVDFSLCSEEAFRVACEFARLCGAKVLVAHVIDLGAVETLNKLGLLAVPSDAAAQKRRLRHHARLQVRRLLESDTAKGIAMKRVVLEGVPFIEIAKMARVEKADLVVMGSYGGRSGAVDKIFFGSTAEKVVRTTSATARPSFSRNTSLLSPWAAPELPKKPLRSSLPVWANCTSIFMSSASAANTPTPTWSQER